MAARDDLLPPDAQRELLGGGNQDSRREGGAQQPADAHQQATGDESPTGREQRGQRQQHEEIEPEVRIPGQPQHRHRRREPSDRAPHPGTLDHLLGEEEKPWHERHRCEVAGMVHAHEEGAAEGRRYRRQDADQRRNGSDPVPSQVLQHARARARRGAGHGTSGMRPMATESRRAARPADRGPRPAAAPGTARRSSRTDPTGGAGAPPPGPARHTCSARRGRRGNLHSTDTARFRRAAAGVRRRPRREAMARATSADTASRGVLVARTNRPFAGRARLCGISTCAPSRPNRARALVRPSTRRLGSDRGGHGAAVRHPVVEHGSCVLARSA